MESIADEMPRLAAKKGARILIGFAAETDDLEANARAKLKRKGLDLIVANDVTREGAGFEVDTNIVTLIGSDGSLQSHPQMSKDAVADLILDRIVAIRAVKPKSGRAEKSSRLRAVR
jgi:phosphopantothenoylcysteine decarboxylase/phosphopantothenate--cysteine ligase